MKSPHRRPIIHAIERSNFIRSHGWHIQQAGHLVHNADTRESMLALSQIQNRHDSRFFVLGRVAGEDFLDEFLICGVELEGDGGVVVGGVSVLWGGMLAQ